VEFNSGNDSQTLAPFELMTEVPDELAHILKTDFPVYFCARPGNVLLIVKVSGSYYQKAFDIDSTRRISLAFMDAAVAAGQMFYEYDAAVQAGVIENLLIAAFHSGRQANQSDNPIDLFAKNCADSYTTFSQIDPATRQGLIEKLKSIYQALILANGHEMGNSILTSGFAARQATQANKQTGGNAWTLLNKFKSWALLRRFKLLLASLLRR
jgi:hypothetical protein